ncbi:MAG: gliding motility-associated C-terminal domain-containing protein [Saprospiraceae bacterium]|nr:gliding motility-associated C-terminal domain-containing protein [Saprospiraceae bacterium]MDW8228775.1 gliding motility-associated C-terminal domain-containing protein [Saprospiraceae bacterium]
MFTARFWFSIVFFWISASLMQAQDCFSVNLANSRAIYASGEAVALPAAGGKVQMPCTQAIRNFAFVIQFVAGAERYFEDSTQFIGVLNHKNSTFVLQYDKSQNTFRLATNQSLGEGAYTLTLSSIMCAPLGIPCKNCFVQYSFGVEYVNDPTWGVTIETEPDPAVLTCLPGSKVLLKGSQPPHGAFQVQWARLVGVQFVDIPGATQPNYTTSLSGTYLYTVAGPAGCRASNLIAVRPPERPDIQVAEPQQRLNSCAQPITGVSVADSSSPGNLVIAWTPSLGGVLLSGTTTLSPMIGTPGVYTLIVRRTDNGCADTAAVNVVPGDIPVVKVNVNSVSGSDILDCKTTALTLRADASLSSGVSSYAYQWSNGATTATITVNKPGIYAVTVTAIDNGCIGYGDRAVFQNIQPPVASISSSRDTVCAGESAVLSVMTSDPAAFRWSDGSTGMVLSVTPPADGSNTYTVTVTSASNGCSAVVERSLVRIPYPPLTCLPAEITLSHGQTATLNCTTTPLAQLHWTAAITNVAGISTSGIGPVQGRRFELASLKAPGRAVFIVFARRGTCASTPAQVTVNVLPPTAEGIYIPEVIVPDDEGQGGLWKIVLPPDAADPSAYAMVIYNRMGAIVWENTLATPFQAANYPDGVYFYVLTPPDGTPIRGAVSILRRK